MNDIFNLNIEFVDLPVEIGLEAANLMDRHGMTPFDAVHALMAGHEIMSTDKVYEKAGLKRVNPAVLASEL